MKNSLLVFTLILIAAIAGLRFFFPEQAAELQTQASEIIENRIDYSGLVQVMGERLSESGLREGITEVFRFFESDGTDARY